MWLTSSAKEAEITSNCAIIISETTWLSLNTWREGRGSKDSAVPEPTGLGEDRFWNEVGNIEVTVKEIKNGAVGSAMG